MAARRFRANVLSGLSKGTNPLYVGGMGKLLVFQHVPYEILGTFDPLLKDQGFRVRYVNFGREPDADFNVAKYDGLVVLGGPMNVGQVADYPHLATEMDAMKEALDHNIPVMGICLGAQLLAKTLGAKVTKCPEKEIGWYDVTPTEQGLKDPVLGHFGRTRKIFEWHGDAFETPDDALCLAGSKAWPNQAFRYGDRAYGFQFHLEVDEALINRWLATPRYIEELSGLEGRTDPQTIRRETALHTEDLKDFSSKVFGSFIEILGHQKKFRTMRSR